MKKKNFKIKNIKILDNSYYGMAKAALDKQNKYMYEDVFKNRFKYRIKEYRYNEYEPYYSLFCVEFIDEEEPERNKEDWFDFHNIIWGGFGACKNAWQVMNNFIIYSDFWKKWHNDYNYAKNHWYSGEQLKDMMDHCGEEWLTPETLAKARPDRWPNSPYSSKKEKED